MLKMILKRNQHLKDRTLGLLEVENHTFATLELPWRDNQKNISCIPCGTYKVIGRWSRKLKNHLMLLDVPGRSKILIHAGNFPRDTEGCILVGKDFKDLNGDNVMDVSTSRVALDEILELVNKSFEIELEIKDGIDNV